METEPSSLSYVYRHDKKRPRLRAVGSSSGSSSTVTAVSSRSRTRSPLTVPTQRNDGHRNQNHNQTVNQHSPQLNARNSHHDQHQHPIQSHHSPIHNRRTVFYLNNADSNVNTQSNNRYHIRSVESVIQEPSYISVGRRRHLYEAKHALNIPPVATFICLMHLIFYLFKEKLFQITTEEDIYVSWDLVWVQGEYWRLFIAQFFHFNRLSMLVNSITLFTIGRYVERKVKPLAMIAVIIVMSVLAHFIYIVINPWCLGNYCCKEPQATEFILGFGSVIYSLRVLLAYSIEPRNYERDLVFGFYPMVVSATHAPWQPIMDLVIFKVVLPEQCITHQVAGIVAGFLVTAVLLLWPFEGVYIANPPYYYWTMTGQRNPSDFDGSMDGQDNDDDERGEQWRMRTFTNSNFWLPTSSHAMLPPSEMQSTTSTQVVDIDLVPRRVRRSIGRNTLKTRSDETKAFCKLFLKNPKTSMISLVRSLTTTQQEREEDERRKQVTEERKRRIKRKLIRRESNNNTAVSDELKIKSGPGRKLEQQNQLQVQMPSKLEPREEDEELLLHTDLSSSSENDIETLSEQQQRQRNRQGSTNASSYRSRIRSENWSKGEKYLQKLDLRQTQPGHGDETSVFRTEIH